MLKRHPRRQSEILDLNPCALKATNVVVTEVSLERPIPGPWLDGGRGHRRASCKNRQSKNTGPRGDGRIFPQCRRFEGALLLWTRPHIYATGISAQNV